MEKSIPDIIVSRLPKYLQALQNLQRQGILNVSSHEFGEAVGITAAQIRKDLSQFGEFGKQGKGYDVPFLVDQLQSILKIHRAWDIALVGAGSLGSAIARYNDLPSHGFRIVMAFDNDPNKIGQPVGNILIEDAINLQERIHSARLKVAILTVPAIVAQNTAETLVKAGIEAILNYAPIILSVPESVHVQNVDPILYLQRMTYYL